MPYLYFYCSSQAGTKTIIELIPVHESRHWWIHLRDLEGILITEKQIPRSEHEFPDSSKFKIEETYNGKFDSFKNYE